MRSLAVVLVLAVAGPASAGDEAADVYRELGRNAPAMNAGEVPKAYLPDAVTPADVAKDPDRYPFRKAVLDAAATLARRRDPTLKVLTDLPEKALKKVVTARQEETALAVFELDELAKSLEAALADKRETSPRWRAHAEYLLAESQLSLGFWHEYDLHLGSVRVDGLPPLDKAAGQDRWEPVRVERMKSRRDVREVVKSARERFARVAADHPGTPWAKLADGDREKFVGLAWQPAAKPKPVK